MAPSKIRVIIIAASAAHVRLGQSSKVERCIIALRRSSSAHLHRPWRAGLSQGVADAIGVGLVVGVITYASLIVGELVPKQIALRDPEAVAVKVAPAMTLLAKASLPLVWLLDRLLQFDRSPAAVPFGVGIGSGIRQSCL